MMAILPADPGRTSEFESLKRAICTFYAKTWADWYEAIPDAKPATLVIERSDHTSLYRPERDAIHLYVTDDQLGQGAPTVALPWPTWKIELVHEMLHEWEGKGFTGPSAAAEALWRQHRRRFEPDHEVEIDAVSRGRESRARWRALPGRAGAGRERGAAATAGIGGGDELEAGGEAGGASGAGDDDAGVLERLAQGLQHTRGELGQLV